MKHSDTELLDWLATRSGDALVSDDAGRWAVSDVGFQNMPDPEKPIDIWNTIFVAASDWRENIRDAIEAAMQKDESESTEEP